MLKDLPTGWLSPTGELIKCSVYDHLSYAREILDKMETPYRDAAPDDALIALGYVKISVSTLWFHGWSIWWSDRHRLSYEQRRFLTPYFDDPDDIDTLTLERWMLEE